MGRGNVKEDIGVWCAAGDDEARSTKDRDRDVDGVGAESDCRSCVGLQVRAKVGNGGVENCANCASRCERGEKGCEGKRISRRFEEGQICGRKGRGE